MGAAPAAAATAASINLPCAVRAPRRPTVGYDAASGLATLLLPKAGSPRTWCTATVTAVAPRAMGLDLASTVLWKFTNAPAVTDGLADAVAATAKPVDLAQRSGVHTSDARKFRDLVGHWPRDAQQRENVLWLLRSAAALTAGMRTQRRPGLLINVVRARVVVWRLGRAARTENAGIVIDFVIGPAQILIASTGQAVLIARTTSNPGAY